MHSVARHQVGRLPLSSDSRPAPRPLAPPRAERAKGPHRRQLWRHAKTTIAALVLCAGCAGANAEWYFDADAGVNFDSNLTGAPSGPDARSDWAAAFGASAGQFFALSGNDSLTLAVNVRGELYDRYHGLNLAAIGASARYRHRFGLGRDAPSVSLVVNSLYADYRDDVRDGARFDVRAELQQRIAESVDVVAGVAYDRRYGPHGEAIVPGFSGEVFSLTGRSVYLKVDYTIDDPWLLSVRGAVRRGDVESTSQQGRAVFRASTAIAPDPAFNDPNLFAYRLPGTTWSMAVTSSYAFNDRSSLNLQYAYAFTDSPQDLEYRNHFVGLVYVHRF